MGHVGVGLVIQGGLGHAGVGVGHADMRWIMYCGSHRGGMGHSGVNGENNRFYSHLSPMQNYANQCDKESL